MGAGERVCVVGENGKGKTTLLKLLAGKLTPQSGQTNYHPSTIKGLFEQTNVNSLVDTRTVEEEILYSHPDIDRQRARKLRHRRTPGRHFGQRSLCELPGERDKCDLSRSACSAGR